MLVEYATILFNSKQVVQEKNNQWTLRLIDVFNVKPNSYLGLKEVVYTNSFLAVNSNNNKFSITEYDGVGGDPQTQTITIPVGSYTSTAMKNEVENQLNSNTQHSISYTVTFSDTTSKFTITNTSSQDVEFDFDVASSAYQLLGFDKSTYTLNSGNSYAVTSVNIARLDGSLTDLIIESPTISTAGFIDSVSANGSGNIIGSVQRIGNFYDEVFYFFENESKVRITSDQFQNLTIRVVDQDLNDVTFQSGSSFSLKLAFYSLE